MPEVPAWLSGRLKMFYPLYRSITLWSDADGLRMAAAMSFYGILSLAPLLVLLVALLGWWLDREVLETSLINQIGGLVGRQGADVVAAAIASAREPSSGVLASGLAFVLLLLGATGVFAELQSAFERLWTQGTGVLAKDDWWRGATLRLRGIAYVLAFGFLMLISLAMASLVSLLEAWAGQQLGMKMLMVVLNQVLSFLITTALFVGLMRMSAGPQPSLRHLLVGGVVGAVLFGVGKYGLTLYLSTAAVVSAYGAAGSLVVLLFWIYFASGVLLYGASVARVSAERAGQFSPEVKPPSAAAITAVQGELREQAGEAAGSAGTAALAAVLADEGSASDRTADEALIDGTTQRRPRVSPFWIGVAAVAGAAASYALAQRERSRIQAQDATTSPPAVVSASGRHLDVTRPERKTGVRSASVRAGALAATVASIGARLAAVRVRPVPPRRGLARLLPARLSEPRAGKLFRQWMAPVARTVRGIGARLLIAAHQKR